MGRRVLRRHTWGYSVCLCPIKGTPGLNELNKLKSLNMINFTSRKLIESSWNLNKHVLEGMDVGVLWSNMVEETRESGKKH